MGARDNFARRQILIPYFAIGAGGALAYSIYAAWGSAEDLAYLVGLVIAGITSVAILMRFTKPFAKPMQRAIQGRAILIGFAWIAAVAYLRPHISSSTSDDLIAYFSGWTIATVAVLVYDRRHDGEFLGR